MCGEDAPFAPGNALPLELIPDGAEVHNIEMRKGTGGKLVRGAGTAARLMSKVRAPGRAAPACARPRARPRAPVCTPLCAHGRMPLARR
jgi:hypothetical protein